jgi:hypothetical protein
MSNNVKALHMGPSRSSPRHGPPLLGRVQGLPVPRRHGSYAALRLPAPVGHGSGSPCQWPTSWRTLVLCPQGRRHVRPLTCRASETTHRLSAKPECRRGEARASQVTGPSSSYVLWSNTPPDTVPSSPIGRRRSLWPSRISARSASGKHRFRGRSPTARTFACLRIADGLSATVARLATGRAGSPLAGRVLHPLDDIQNFMEDVCPPIPIDPQGLVALKYLYADLISSPLWRYGGNLGKPFKCP